MSAATVSGDARRVLLAVKAAGGTVGLGDLAVALGDHTLATAVVELDRGGLLELVGPDGKPRGAQGVAIRLRSGGYRQEVRREVTVRLPAGVDRLPLRVPSG